MKKFNKPTAKTVKKWLLRGTTFVVVAGATLFGAYALTPNKKKTVEISNSQVDDGPASTTYFNKFVTKVTDSLDTEGEQFGLGATLNNLEITWPTKDGLSMNDITIDGGLDIIMRSLNDFDVTVDLSADYNGRSVDLALGYVSGDIYLALQDLRIKSSSNSTKTFLEYVMDQFFDPSNPDGLGIDLNLQSFIDETLGSFDIMSLLGSMSLPQTTETVVGSDVIIDLIMDDIAISLTIDKEELFIKCVNLGELHIGDVTISGSLECEVIDKVIAFDDPLYPNPKGEFTEVITYIGWVDRLLDLFKTRKVGFDFNAQVSLDDEETGESKLMDLEASINIDASEVLDFTNLKIGKDDDSVGRASTIDYQPTDNELKSVYNPDGKLSFGIHASMKGQDGSEYMNFDLSYFDNAGYLTLNENALNEAVMRAKIDEATIASLINKLPEIISSLTVTDTSKEMKQAKAFRANAADAGSDLLSFLTSSSLINSIKNGDYSEIIDIIKDISNDQNGVNLTLNLAPIGLGSNSEVGLKLDSSKDAQNTLAVSVKDIEVGPINLSANLDTTNYSDETINNVKENKDNYDDMAFADGVVTQVSDILNVKNGLLTLSGSVLDENNCGVNLNGKAQFDANAKVGYGTVNIRQHDDKVVNQSGYIDHQIDFDVNNDKNKEDERNLLFAYNGNLKAKMTTTTITDIIDLVMDLMHSDDERFTKFDGMIQELLLGTALKQIIETKDYLQLASSSFLSSIKQTNNGNTIAVTISGKSLGMESDINIRINFKEVEGAKQIASLDIVNLSISGLTINMNVALDSYTDSYVSPINHNDTFMDFSQVRVLLDFGINTTKLSYYHLSAKAVLSLANLDAINFDLDFHIHVDGKKTKVYGSIPKVPWVTDFISADIGSCSIESEFVFEPTEDIGGVFHIVKNKDFKLLKDTVTYYQADSKSFLEGIISYLAVDMLNVRKSVISDLGNTSLSSERTKDPDYSKIFTDTGFNYSHNGETGINTWKLGINMSEILCNDSLGGLEVTLNGREAGTSGFFETAHVEMGILSFITIKADLTLENPSFETKDWPDDIEAKYNKVLSWYNNLSASDKANFDANYKNQPLKDYLMVEQRGYF